MRGISGYVFDFPHTFMVGWSNNEEGFEIFLGLFAIVFFKQ